MDDNSVIYTYTFTAAGTGYTNLNLNLNNYIPTPVKRIQVEISGSAPTLKIFEFSIDYDARPEQLNFLILKPENYGIAGRKRIPSIPMIIDTLGTDVLFAPIIDSVLKPGSTINKSNKDLFIHYFKPSEIGYMMGGVLTGSLFEFYGLIQQRNLELLPDPATYIFTNYSNLGTSSRKRITQYARKVDTHGHNITLTPYIDGTSYPPLVINSSRKQTHIYTFPADTIGVDIACELSGDFTFEDYGENLEESVFEKLPSISKHKFSNYTNFGSSSRKRIVQYARVVDTKGRAVTLTPWIDGVAYPSLTINSSRKQTHIYTFTTDTTGIEIACELHGDFEFEDYGENLEECITEKLPKVTKFINLSTTNFGIANKKRIRTIPFVLNSKGGNVTYTPAVDGVIYPSSVLSSIEKRTLLHYFETDSFGIDYGGTLSSNIELTVRALSLLLSICLRKL